MEYGIVIPSGLSKLRSELSKTLTTHSEKLTSMSREIFYKLIEEFRSLDEQVEHWDRKIQAVFKSHPECRRIAEVPGVGPITATAVIASVAAPSQFKNGRQMAAYLGLVPRQNSSGGKDRLLGISKRGDVYLRTLLIHGARASIQHIGEKSDRSSQWVRRLVERRGKNRAAVALANKNARIIWVLLTKKESYKEAA